jgi:hypothetical protein
MRDSERRLCVVMQRAAVFLTLMGIVTGTCVAQSNKPLPAVSSASVPFYPRMAQAAHIEGVVRLRISTSDFATMIAVESGPPMLAKAAAENVNTWQFEKHAPATFEATFHYVLLPSKCDSECNCDDVRTNSVQLQLPTEVEVSAKEEMTCDPAEKR